MSVVIFHKFNTLNPEIKTEQLIMTQCLYFSDTYTQHLFYSVNIVILVLLLLIMFCMNKANLDSEAAKISSCILTRNINISQVHSFFV